MSNTENVNGYLWRLFYRFYQVSSFVPLLGALSFIAFHLLYYVNYGHIAKIDEYTLNRYPFFSQLQHLYNLVLAFNLKFAPLWIIFTLSIFAYKNRALVTKPATVFISGALLYALIACLVMRYNVYV